MTLQKRHSKSLRSYFFKTSITQQQFGKKSSLRNKEKIKAKPFIAYHHLEASTQICFNLFSLNVASMYNLWMQMKSDQIGMVIKHWLLLHSPVQESWYQNVTNLEQYHLYPICNNSVRVHLLCSSNIHGLGDTTNPNSSCINIYTLYNMYCKE